MTEIYIGALSGTSMDAIDVAAFSFGSDTPQLLSSHSMALPPEYKTTYAKIIDSAQCTLNDLGELDRWTGELFATAIIEFLSTHKMAAQDITAIGSHGQTLWHAPSGNKAFTLQIGDPNIIAVRTGITTVADFRRADIAAGGQGAPLAPAFHLAAFSSADETRCIVNIGGISNISILHKSTVQGFDTGPGNCLLDAWTQLHFNAPYDTDGKIAHSGTLNQDLLNACLADPYFSKAPPKSSGREYFNMQWLQRRLHDSNATQVDPSDVLATLTHLTANCISNAVLTYAADCTTVYLCGGGAKNLAISNALNAKLNIPIKTTADLGIDPQWVEAGLFAWLAQQRIQSQTIDLTMITGAKQPVTLGGIFGN